MLEREFDVVPYTSQQMAVAVLVAAENALANQVEAKVADIPAEDNQQVAEPKKLD